MSVLDSEIAKLARDNYLISGLREKVSLWTEDQLLHVYNRLLAVYDSAYTENVDLKNKPKALKAFHKSVNLMGLGHLAQYSDAMLDPYKASRIFSAVDDKITARYGKGAAQRNRNVMKQEDIKCKKNPKQPIISTTNVENIPPRDGNLPVNATPKWEIISQEKFILGTPSNDIPAINVIPVPPKGREIERTPLRQSNVSSNVISPPNAFKTPSVITAKCSITGKIIPAGSKIPRTPEGELQSDSLPTGRQIPRTPVIENTNGSDISTNFHIKGRELARTPVGSIAEVNESNKLSDTFEVPSERNELSRTPVHIISERDESNNKRSTFEIPLKGNQLARTPTNDSHQVKVSSNKSTAFEISLKGNQLARTPTNTNDINQPASSDRGQPSKSSNLSAENMIPKGRQLSRTPQNCDKSIDDNKTCINSTFVQNDSSENRRGTFDGQLQPSDTTFDIFEPPIQFCDESNLISPPSDFAIPSSNIIMPKSKTTLTEIDRRGSYVHEKCSVKDSTFTVESDDRRGTFTVNASHNDSIFQSLDKNYVGPVPKRKEKPCLSENNETLNSVNENDTFILNVDSKNIKKSNNLKGNMPDETFTINQTRERLNTDDMSFFDPLADETVNSGRHSLMVKTSDDKPLSTTNKLDETPLLTAYTPEMASDTKAKRVPISKNCIPKGKKQLPRTPTGVDDLIDLKNESNDNGSSSFAVGDLTVEIFVKDKKLDSIQADQKSESNSRGSIGALVSQLDAKIEANSSLLSNTPQKCTPALNIDTPVCSDVRNQDKIGNLSKNILQKNAKNLLQNKLDTINDEEDDSLDIFSKKNDNSSIITDKKENHKPSTDEKHLVAEKQSEVKAMENNKLNHCQYKNNSNIQTGIKQNDTELVDQKSSRDKASEHKTNDQQDLVNKKILENHKKTDKKCKEKEATKEIQHSKEHIKNKSNERENLEKKTEIVEKSKNHSDIKDIKEAKNIINKNEKDQLLESNINENKAKLDLQDYIDLHKKPTLKNYKIPKISKQERVEEKGSEQTKTDSETMQSVSANSDKEKNGKSKLHIMKDSEMDKKMKSKEFESKSKLVEKSSKEKSKSPLEILVSDLNESSDFNDSLEIFPLKTSKIFKSNKNCRGDTELDENKLEKGNKDMNECIKAKDQKELSKEKESPEEIAKENKCPSKDKSKAKEQKTLKPKKETKTNTKSSKTTKVDQAVVISVENLDQINKTEHVSENAIMNDNTLEPITDKSNKGLCLKEPRESLGSILPTPLREILRTDDNELLESTRNQDLLTTPAITNILVKDEFNSQVKNNVTQRNTLKINPRSKGRKLNVDLQTESIDDSKASKLKISHKKTTKESQNAISVQDKTDKKAEIKQVEKKIDQNKVVLSKIENQNEPKENPSDDQENSLRDAKSKDTSEVLDELGVKGDSLTNLVQLANKQQSKPVQRRGKNTRLSMEVIVKKKVDKDNSINESTQHELSLEGNTLSKDCKESAPESTTSKKNMKIPSNEKKAKNKTQVETDVKDVETVDADNEVAKTGTKPAAKRRGRALEVQAEEKIQQVDSTIKNDVAKRGRKAKEVQLEESALQVDDMVKKPAVKRGRKVKEDQLEEAALQVDEMAKKPAVKRGRKAKDHLEESIKIEQVDDAIKKPVTKRGRKMKDTQLEDSMKQVEQVNSTITKPVIKRGRKAAEVKLDESTHVEKVTTSNKKPVTKRGKNLVEDKLEDSTQNEKVASTITKPFTKRGRKVAEVETEKSTQEANTKPITKRGRKVAEVNLEKSAQQDEQVNSTEVEMKDLTQVEEKSTTSTKHVTKRGRKVSQVESEKLAQDVKQLVNTTKKPITKRGKKVSEVQLEESTLANDIVKPPSRRGKTNQNLNTSSLSKGIENTSLSNNPTPKGSRRSSLLNNSTAKALASLETKNSRPRQGRTAVSEEPNSSALQNVRGPRNVGTKIEATNQTESNDTKSKSKRGRGKKDNTDLDESLISVDKIIDKEPNKSRGRSKQVKPIENDANGDNTNLLNKKENQKKEITKADKNLHPKENIKAITKSKRQQKEDSSTSPEKKRKIEKLSRNMSSVKNIINADVSISEESNLDKKRKPVDKRKKASTETLDTSALENIKPGRKRAAKMTEVECSPEKKGKVMKKTEINATAAAPSVRGSRKCKTAASEAIKDLANEAADLSLTKRKSRRT